MKKPFELSEIPQPIKVGYRTFKIEWFTPLAEVRSNRYGEMDFAAQTIILSSILDRQQAAETLMHEILHAIWRVWEMPDTPRQISEEDAVGHLSNGLATVIADNPGLFAWIESNLTHQKTAKWQLVT